MAIESPRYQVLEKSGRIERRRYDGFITAYVEITADSYNDASNKAFRLLADYIFGNNTTQAQIAMTAPVSSKHVQSSEKIAMTAPVSTSKTAGRTYEVAFTMPSSYSMTNLPKPNNNEVKLKQTLAHEVAVIEFAGYTTDGKINKLSVELQDWASQKRLVLIGEPTVSRYDPPWKPGFMRRNELSFIVK